MDTKENELESIKLELILGKKEPTPEDEKLNQEEKAFERIRESEFIYGSLEEAKKHKLFMIARYLFVEGAGSSAEAVQIARSKIIRCLREIRAVFKMTEETRTKLHQLSNRIRINLVVEEYIDISEYPDKPRENIRECIRETIQHILWEKQTVLITLTELSHELSAKGVDITNSDLFRIFIYEINRFQMYPRILCIPNEDFPHNPYVLLYDNASPLPVEIMRLLRVFDR